MRRVSMKGRFAGPVPTQNLYADDKEDFKRFEPFPDGFGSTPRAFPPGEQLQVMNINMCKETNEASHNTSDYVNSQLVVRRGQQFVIEVTFNRPVVPQQDDFQVDFLIGSDPAVNKGSHEVVTFGNREGGSWAGQILGTQDTVVTLGITPSAKAIFGLYRMYVGVSTGNGIERTQKDTSTNVYLLFNPWCPDDDVYYADDAGRWEYVLNSSGIIYQGSVDQVAERSWVYGQHDEGILDASIFVLDSCQMPIFNRNDVIKIVRAASAGMNSQDDNGVLVGNWSDDFSMGTPPTSWTGSCRILQQYHGSGNPVCFGQCWVFAGVLCTFLRSIGIPGRVITNFNSAHDNNANLKTELIFTPDGAPDRANTRDSIWNYHCWCEAFMKRNDIPAQYSGWQVVDATPQETSDGFYRCGPTSVAAVKEGDVCYPFDGGFVFAEVNSDIIYLKRDKYDKLETFKVDTTSVGALIYTKAVGAWAPENITFTYKYPEGSEEDKRTMQRAEGYGVERDQSEVPESKLSVKVMAEPSHLGGVVKVMVTFNNVSGMDKIVKAQMETSVVFYTGVASARFKVEKFNVHVPAHQNSGVMIEIPPQEYMPRLGSKNSLQIVVNGQTDTEHVSDVTVIHFQLPSISIAISGSQQVNRKTYATITFKNPFNMPLQNATLCIEGSGLLSLRRYTYRTIAPYAVISQTVEFTPNRAGLRIIVALLDCDNMAHVEGRVEFRVIP